MSKLAAIVEYDGSDFAGWQKQAHDVSVQDVVEAAISYVAGHPVAVVCAGRTDAGVHAAAQVIHFETSAQRAPRAWVLGSNTKLPPTVALKWANPVSDDFHARHRALRRTYRYCILNRSARSPLQRQRAAWIHRRLDADALHEVAQVLIGEHDFSALRSTECQSKTAVRRVDALNVQRVGDYLWIEITATAFLHHMVRNIVGTLIDVVERSNPRAALQEILLSRERKLAGPTAPAHGLYFWSVEYRAEYGIPCGVADFLL